MGEHPTTPSQTIGPFFHDSLPYEHGPRLVAAGEPDAITLSGTVYDGAGAPIPDALVEIWHADARGGFVDTGSIFGEATAFRGFGRCPTDGDGHYAFATVRPAAVPTVDGDLQAPHIAMSVFARGMLRRVATRVYFDDQTEIHADDPLLSSVDESRRPTLVARSDAGGGFVFDVHLQGDHETVFLDIFAR